MVKGLGREGLGKDGGGPSDVGLGIYVSTGTSSFSN